MMALVFWATTAAAVIFLAYNVLAKKDVYSFAAYILIGIYFPLMLSFLDWSYYYTGVKYDKYYYIFVLFNVLVLLLYSLPQGKIQKQNISIQAKPKKIPVLYYNLFYIVCVLLENYYVSGYFFPSFHGLDIHTSRAPYVYIVTTAVYLFTLLDIIEFIVTKKKRYLVWTAVLISLNVISKSSRIDAFISAVQVLSFVLFYLFSKKGFVSRIINRSRAGKAKRKWPVMLALAVLIPAIIFGGISIGNYRMNKYGRYDISYAKGIGYTGPESAGDVIAFYYGYFAMSFNNLNYNVGNAKINPNYVGYNSFRALYFGVLQFDNLFKISGGESTRANIVRCKGTAIPTGFWDFYYDYGMFCFIPILLSLLIYYLLRMKACRQKVSLGTVAVYFYWVPLWMFFSFDNRVYDYAVIWQCLLIYFVMNGRYTMRYDELSPYETEKP